MKHKKGFADTLLTYLGAYGNHLETREVAEGNFCLKLMPGFAKEAVVERRSQWNAGFRFEGKSDAEWVYVEHMVLAPDHVNDDIESWVGIGMAFLGKPLLHCKSDRDNADFEVVKFGLVPAISSVFMKKHSADDMATYVGTILRKGVMCRVFILCIRRGNESWMVEYVFPAYVTETRVEGGKLTVHETRPPKPGEKVDVKISQGEMQIAGVVLGNFRALDGIHCSFCDKVVTEEDVFPVEMGNTKLFDNMPLRGSATFRLPCCDDCKRRITVPSLDLDRIKAVADIRDALAKGADFKSEWINSHNQNP